MPSVLEPDFGCPCLSRYLYRFCRHGRSYRPMRYHAAEIFLERCKGSIPHGHSRKLFPLDGLHDGPCLGVPDFLEEMGPVDRSLVHNHGNHVRHLERCGEKVALADGGIHGVSQAPSLVVGLLLPFWSGYLARGLSGKVYPAEFAIAEIFGITDDIVDSEIVPSQGPIVDVT